MQNPNDLPPGAVIGWKLRVPTGAIHLAVFIMCLAAGMIFDSVGVVVACFVAYLLACYIIVRNGGIRP